LTRNAVKTRSRRVASVKTVPPAFWDTSAVIPLCIMQPQSTQARQAARRYPKQVVWWLTGVEAYSSLSCLAKDGFLDAGDSRRAFAAIETLRERWSEVQPVEEVRTTAERLLRTHTLRAADALQLAAALIWCGNHPRGHAFVCADLKLSQAAEVEGFAVVRVS
jgi:predicted nucleic acid-binding protein